MLSTVPQSPQVRAEEGHNAAPVALPRTRDRRSQRAWALGISARSAARVARRFRHDSPPARLGWRCRWPARGGTFGRSRRPDECADTDAMARQIVVLGGGTGGTLIANRLRRQLADDDVITVVDRDGQHVYQPGLLFVPFGRVQAERLTRPRVRQLHRGIGYHQSGASQVDIDARRVHLRGRHGAAL